MRRPVVVYVHGGGWCEGKKLILKFNLILKKLFFFFFFFLYILNFIHNIYNV